ncbi:MAG TPA: hypothetical protein VNX29_15915 [Kaistia sp.]|nr:hypothetical protein [Kaistia sp.]
MLFPRFRSKERDLRSDIDRLSSIQEAVSRALSDTENESTGLAARLEDARSRAAFLYGDVIEGDDGEASKSSILIQEAERFLVRGERRRDELGTHAAFLRQLEEQLTRGIDTLRQQQKIED